VEDGYSGFFCGESGKGMNAECEGLTSKCKVGGVPVMLLYLRLIALPFESKLLEG
jgi:hypothetical protein